MKRGKKPSLLLLKVHTQNSCDTKKKPAAQPFRHFIYCASVSFFFFFLTKRLELCNDFGSILEFLFASLNAPPTEIMNVQWLQKLPPSTMSVESPNLELRTPNHTYPLCCAPNIHTTANFVRCAMVVWSISSNVRPM